MLRILDACCGSRMFWFDKENEDTVYMDIRQYHEELITGHVIDVKPDIVADFRDMPFADDTFDLIAFDPPHLVRAGEKSWMAKKYGKLDKVTWARDLKQGFDECMRVLKPSGTLVFKWNDDQISANRILEEVGYRPLFGQKRQKTHWMVFNKQTEVLQREEI